MPSRFAAAFRFLTTIPILSAGELSPVDLARSMAAFPLVGLSLGGALLVVHWAVGSRLPPPLEGAVLVGLLAWATGGLHLDGLADTADGLAGGWTRERALEIMKDSRTGAVGAAALCIALLVKSMSMGLLPPAVKSLGILLAPAVARGTVVHLTYRSTYARPVVGLGKPYAEHLDGPTLRLALLGSGVPCILLGWVGLAAFGLTLLYAHGLKAFAHRKFGGITGDVLGFGVESAEIVFLLLLHVLP